MNFQLDKYFGNLKFLKKFILKIYLRLIQTKLLDPYDIYIVGYPKVGNTWFQIMLRKALVSYYSLPDYWFSKILDKRQKIPKGIPAIKMTHNMPDYNSESFKTMKLDNKKFKNKKVILLVRDPKDVLVSLYMHNVYRVEKPLFEGHIDSMVYSEIYGIEKYIKFYKKWEDDKYLPKALLLIRYEDLKLNTAAVFKKVLNFIGMTNIDDLLLHKIVDYGSFKNMKSLEMNNTLGLSTLAPSSKKGENSFKVRKGIIGGYVDHLSKETIEYIDRKVLKELPDFYGYPWQNQ